MPAWTARDLEQVDWYYPPLNPQENVCLPFQNNLNTRILEKNCFENKRQCLSPIDDLYTNVPTKIMNYNYKPTRICTQDNSCETISKK